MEAFLIYLLKVSGLVALFWLFYQLILKKITFFAANRWFFIMGLLTSLCLPLLYFTKIVWIDPLHMVSVPVVNFGATEIPIQQQESFDWSIVLYTIYFLGTAFLAMRFLAQLYTLRKLIRKGKRHKVGSVRMVESNKEVAPFSFFSGIVYNPKEYSKEELQTIIAHEKVHVRQLHSLDILFTHLILIFQWFNPFMWLYRAALHQNLEFLADQGAASANSSKKAYQYLLLKTGANIPNYAFTNPFFNSSIKKRIVMLNSRKSNRTSMFKYGLVLPLLVGFILFFNIKTVAKVKPNALDQTISKVQSEKTTPKLYTITKETSEGELDAIIQKVKGDGGELHIERIKRNDTGLIVDISVRYDSKTGGNTTGNSSDKKGISNVYFGISKEGGAFISFKKEAIPYIMEGKSYHEPMKEGEEINSSFTRTDANGKSVTTYVKRVMKNGKEILYVNGKESTEEELNKLGIYTERPVQQKDTIKILGYANPLQLYLTKDTDDALLESLKHAIEEKFGGKLTYSKLKRNSSGEIITLDIAYTSETEGGVSWHFDKNEPIPNILFKRNEKNGLHIEIIEAPFGPQLGNVRLTRSGTSGDVSINVYQPADSTFFDRQITTKDSVHIQNNIVVGQQTLLNHMQNMTNNPQSTLPLYLLDGKEITFGQMTSLKPEDIASINVTRGELGSLKYGEKAKHGIVNITSKKMPIVIGLPIDSLKTKDTNPWKVSYGKAPNSPIKSTSVIDYHNEASKMDSKLKLPDFDNSMIVIDGKESTKKELEKLNMDDVASISVIRNGGEAMKKYGKKAINGVVEIITKKDVEQTQTDFSKIITKNTTDKQLQLLVSKMRKNKLNFSYKDLKRNKKGEIIHIYISIKDEIGPTSGSSTWSRDSQPIPNIQVGRINGQTRVSSSF